MRLFSFFSSLISKHSILYEPCNQTISFSLDKSVFNINDNTSNDFISANHNLS